MLQDVTIPLDDGSTRPGVLLLPETGAGPHPGVVIIHDIYGFRRDTRRHCRRFAEAGYAAVAPNLYGGGRPGCVVETLRAMVQEGAPPSVAAARQFLAERPEVDPARIGITGFCMGGGFALIAAADDSYAVAAPFYGVVPKQKERLANLCPTLPSTASATCRSAATRSACPGTWRSSGSPTRCWSTRASVTPS